MSGKRVLLWLRAVQYLVRLSKKKIWWQCAGTALKFIAERRKEINKEIDIELKIKAELALKNGVKSGAHGPAADADPRGRASR